MVQLILIVVSIALVAGFYLLTRLEEKKGARYYDGRRKALDAQVRRIEFIIAHVDFASFAREESRRVVGVVSHAVAHFSLQVVRWVERLLTRAVRSLRVRQQVVPRVVSGETREFVKKLSDFKGQLREHMPEMGPIEKQD